MDPALDKRTEAFELYISTDESRRSPGRKNISSQQNEDNPGELLNIIKERKLVYFGYIMTEEKYEILYLIIEGKLEGKKSV